MEKPGQRRNWAAVRNMSKALEKAKSQQGQKIESWGSGVPRPKQHLAVVAKNQAARPTSLGQAVSGLLGLFCLLCGAFMLDMAQE